MYGLKIVSETYINGQCGSLYSMMISTKYGNLTIKLQGKMKNGFQFIDGKLGKSWGNWCHFIIFRISHNQSNKEPEYAIRILG